ncbi:hypothetical protein [Flavobacterium sp.]|uniref:hypothetical protein n=1 Tax=Flavobacterium sp. TaxID=239 RepID=UPI002B4B6EC9|nr:hypothetical protein [Flavobacterium sp.]HLF51885.1 hypothetical protein [Flavobacterium sp.]
MTVIDFKREANEIFMVYANEYAELDQSITVEQPEHLEDIVAGFSEALDSIYLLYVSYLNDTEEKEIAEYKRVLRVNMSNIYTLDLPEWTNAY